MHHIPGYGGYVRFFEREYVTSKDVPSRKYDDIAPNDASLLRGYRWKSEYSTASDKERLVHHWNKEKEKLATETENALKSTLNASSSSQSSTFPPPATAPLPSDPSSIPPNDSSLNAPATATLRPPAARRRAPGSDQVSVATILRLNTNPAAEAKREFVWSTTYADNYHPSNSALNAHHQQYYKQPISLPQALSSVPFANNLLRNSANQTSAYMQDYGARGYSPLQRAGLVQGGVPDSHVVSHMSTSRDLFAGTTKASARVPGYSAHIPSSSNNRHSIVGGSLNTKDNLIQIYRHDMAGYAGHKPLSVTNDRGPRTPRGKRQVDDSKFISLVVDSMKV